MEQITLNGKPVKLYSKIDAMDLAIEVIQEQGYDTASVSGFGNLYLGVRRAYGVEATLDVSFHNLRLEESAEVKVGLADPTVTVNWSGSSRSIAAAQASIALYQEMVNLAALIECRLSEMRYVGQVLWTKETEEAE